MQIQEPANRSTTTRASVFFAKFAESFFITKYLNQEVNDGFNICMYERNPYGLAITGDIKIY